MIDKTEEGLEATSACSLATDIKTYIPWVPETMCIKFHRDISTLTLVTACMDERRNGLTATLNSFRLNTLIIYIDICYSISIWINFK